MRQALAFTAARTFYLMQTFLPYPDFKKSASVLDWRRLGNQRNECNQLLKALTEGGGWRYHPAALMWEGYEPALRRYRNTIIQEWVSRGYRNSIPLLRSGGRVRMPPWLGCPEFHAAHRSNLLRKNPEFYSQWGWDEPDDLPYVWPVLNEERKAG